MNLSEKVKKVLTKGGEWIALIVVFGGIGTFWINTEVERRMSELMPTIGDDPAVVEAVADIENIEATMLRVETKVDAFSNKFITYLEQQTN